MNFDQDKIDCLLDFYRNQYPELVLRYVFNPIGIYINFYIGLKSKKYRDRFYASMPANEKTADLVNLCIIDFLAELSRKGIPLE